MSETREELSLPLEGMTCAACASTVEKTLRKHNHVLTAEVNYATHTVKLEVTDTNILKSLQKSVKKAGYQLIVHPEEATDKSTKLNKLKAKLIGALPLTVVIVILSMFIGDFAFKNYVLLVLTVPVLYFSGGHFFTSAWKQLLQWQSNMDTLIASGTGAAFVYSLVQTLFPEFIRDQGLQVQVYYESAAVIITFILLGKYLEEKAKAKSSGAIEKLLKLQAKTATLLREDKAIEVHLSQVQPGDLLWVRTGENIPVDGFVQSGNATVDESMLTGESVPVEKSEQEKVSAGTTLLNGSLKIVADKLGNETLLGKIIHMVSDAMGSKAPAQKLADRISSIFVPTVLVLALTTFLLWVFFGGGNAISLAFVSTFSVLIIACPCALGLATPTAIMVGIGKAASQGILIKNAESIEKPQKIKALLFDKTGTLSKGKMEVVASHTFFDSEENLEILSILNGMENQSHHPIAHALSEHLNKTYNLLPFQFQEVETLSGVGLTAQVEDTYYWVTGNNKRNIKLPPEQEKLVKSFERKGYSMVLFWRNESLMAVFGLQDNIKTETKAAIASLKHKGLHLEILSGDQRHAVAAVAEAAGIEDFQAGMLPQDKLNYLKEIQEKYGPTAFVGDGINDAPALAQADLSIAMSTGTDVAIESAQVTLMHGDIQKINAFFRLSKQISQTMQQNLFWAFAYNVVAIPLAAGVFYSSYGFLLSPMIAGGAMAFSSLTVVLNSLRLKLRR